MSTLTEHPAPSGRSARELLAGLAARAHSSSANWWLLGLILILFLFYLKWLHMENYFGRYHDDTVYFSSAQAMACGQGYILPSLPGTPPQTKYPILYPWLLSWIWKWRPGFPENIRVAVWLTAAFACWFLVATFCLLRRIRGIGDRPALLCVALCAYHPFFLSLSGAVLSDMLFMALALSATVIADGALDARRATLPACAAGILAGLSAQTRTIGLTVVAGVLAIALGRRAYRHAVILGLSSALFLVFSLGGAGSVTAPSEPPGWRQTWLYYTSYWQFWRLSVPNWEVLQTMVSSNLKDLVLAPASICLFPPPGGEGSYAGLVLCATLSAGIVAGIARQGRGRQWKAIHFVSLFYIPVTLLWNYPIMNRFMMLFLPLAYAGLWMEGRHVLSMIRENLLPDRPVSHRVLAATLGLAVVALVVVATAHYAGGDLRSGLRAGGQRRAALALEKEEVYDWIRSHTEPTTRFLAAEDVSLFFHTGRQAVWPIAFTTAPFYQHDSADLRFQLAHITDVARAIDARYWVAVEGDYYIETSSPLVRDRLSELKSKLPRVFRSSQGRVELYDLSSITRAGAQPGI